MSSRTACLMCMLVLGYAQCAFNDTSFPKQNTCYTCDDLGKEPCVLLHSTRTKVCDGASPFCMNTAIGMGHGTLIAKGCASLDQCRELWWRETRPNAACNKYDVSNNHLTPGVTCHFCCTDSRMRSGLCNKEIYPSHLVNFTEA